MIPTGFEPISKEPESFILSIELGDRLFLASTKIIKLGLNQTVSCKNNVKDRLFYQHSCKCFRMSHVMLYCLLIILFCPIFGKIIIVLLLKQLNPPYDY